MRKIIQDAAVKYAEDKVLPETALRGFIDGVFFALSHQWRSVEEELPLKDEDLLVFVPKNEFHLDEYIVAYYEGEDWYTRDGEHIRPTHWLPIPSLNPELLETGKEE
ncbi:MAG: DUF551 domain-containing protein [Muribaculaceae bacterium]